MTPSYLFYVPPSVEFLGNSYTVFFKTGHATNPR